MDKIKLIIVGVLALIIVIVIIAMISNTKKSKLKKELEEINTRFNAVKSAPIAFKLNKAQAMAKRNEETASEVSQYYKKYEDAQKHIDQVQELIEHLEDDVALKKKAEAKEAIIIVKENIGDCEKEIEDIEKFLDKFQEEEASQREYSLRLKEEFRNLKLYVNDNIGTFTYANDGVEERITKCEELFSSSEEWMYANDYAKAREDLEKIEHEIKDMKSVFTELPSLIQEAKGVLPVLIEEVEKEYTLTRQRGIYLGHLGIDEKMDKIQKNLNGDLKALLGATVGDVKEHSVESKQELEKMLAALETENSAFVESKEILETVKNNIEELNKLETYVAKGYEVEKERFGLEDLNPYLEEERKKIKNFEKEYQKLSAELSDGKQAPSNILVSANYLHNDSEVERKGLLSYKMKIDQTSSDEQRATAQLQKLQVVVNEIEIKVKEYRLPTISGSYYDDLKKARVYINNLKDLLDEVPINIDKLNTSLDESIDFIYTFYNNVNNVVGMAIMVENAIVFGNKYRSTYPEVDRELSKAEFSYLNGEYTKALTIAITCMEALFPNVTDERFLETA